MHAIPLDHLLTSCVVDTSPDVILTTTQVCLEKAQPKKEVDTPVKKEVDTAAASSSDQTPRGAVIGESSG